VRARNLKPGFFKNEVLGSADPLLSVLFAGLWCLADREGRLEDRPLRICAELFPYRRAVNEKRCDTLLQWLHEHEFIARYEVGGERFIQVHAFLKHQNPHKNERPSTIPPLSSIEHRTSTVQAPERSRKAPYDSGLFSDSPIPDSPIPHSSPPESKTPLPPTSGGASVSDTGEKKPGQGRRANGTNPRANGTHPRASDPREKSLEAWRATLVAVDHVNNSARNPDRSKWLTWAYVREQLGPVVHEAIERAGGHRLIADRDRFTQGALEERFRVAYEQFLDQQQTATQGAA
jgi:hypothetical protein